jgi:hypothetical protein
MNAGGRSGAPVLADVRQAGERPAVRAARLLTYDFLAWLDEDVRTYEDVLATWPSSCPRLSIWEDALDDGLVEARRDDGPGGQVIVRMTPRGRALLAGRR